MDNRPRGSQIAEENCLGGVMMMPSILDEVAAIVQPADFYSPKHQAVFEAILDLDNRKEAVDPVSVSDRMGILGTLDRVGGLPFVVELGRFAITPKHAGNYAKIVRSWAMRRGMAIAAMKLQEAAIAGIDIDEAVEEVQTAVMSLTSIRGENQPRLIRMGLGDWIDDLDNRSQSDRTYSGVSSGFKGIDAKLGGMEGGELIVLAARPSMGKTSLALNIASTAARMEQKPVLFFSLEMPEKQIISRLVASIGGIDIHKLRSGELDDIDWTNITTAQRVVSVTQIVVDESAALTVQEIKARARQVQKAMGLSLVVVDYLQLVTQRAESRTEQIRVISGGLKQLAKEADVPVLALSQLNRDAEGKRPNPAHLRDGGAIEQDADVIMFLYRDPAAEGITELIVAKQRNGPTGTELLQFEAHFTRFKDCLPEDVRIYQETAAASKIKGKGFERG